MFGVTAMREIVAFKRRHLTNGSIGGEICLW
jgi:hypothetical protein